MSQKAIPRNRNEQRIAGYRDVLATIHESREFISITPNVLLRLHRDLYSKLPQGAELLEGTAKLVANGGCRFLQELWERGVPMANEDGIYALEVFLNAKNGWVSVYETAHWRQIGFSLYSYWQFRYGTVKEQLRQVQNRINSSKDLFVYGFFDGSSRRSFVAATVSRSGNAPAPKASGCPTNEVRSLAKQGRKRPRKCRVGSRFPPGGVTAA